MPQRPPTPPLPPPPGPSRPAAGRRPSAHLRTGWVLALALLLPGVAPSPAAAGPLDARPDAAGVGTAAPAVADAQERLERERERPATAPRPSPVLPRGLLELFPREDLKIEINLGSALLALVAEATRHEDGGEFADLVAALDQVTVRILDATGRSSEDGRRLLDDAAETLRRGGWSVVASVRDGSDRTEILLRQAGRRVVGLVVLFEEGGGEAGLVHIGGDVDPAQIARLARRLGLPDRLDDALGSIPDTAPPAPEPEENR